MSLLAGHAKMESKLSVAFCWAALVTVLACVDTASGAVSIPRPSWPGCDLRCPRFTSLDVVRCRCVGPNPPPELLPSPVCNLRECPRSYFTCSKYKTDSRGCQTCECLCSRIPTACPSSCSYGRTYETDAAGCRVCKCKPSPGSKPVCPDVLSCGFCPYGYQRDANGCDTCRCKTRPVQCGPVCKIFCPGGNVLDSRGCPTCRCKPYRSQFPDLAREPFSLSTFQSK